AQAAQRFQGRRVDGRHAGLRGEARYKAWSRYFVETLRTSPGSCLEAGRWLLRLSLAEQVPAWQPPQSHDPRERVLER
ncbi:hypothetical protein ACV35H_33195, partial [Pseudomonas aeruginosa]